MLWLDNCSIKQAGNEVNGHFLAYPMIQTAAAAIKLNGDSQPKRGTRKFLVAFLIFTVIFVGFFYWRQFKHNEMPIVHRAVPVTTVPAAAKPTPSANSSKTENHSTVAKTDSPSIANDGHLAAVKTAVVGFGNSLIAAFSPSAKAATVHQEMPPAPKPVADTALPAKRVPIPTTAAAPPRPAPTLTAEQKRLQVAQEGFGHVMDRAVAHPDIYGFLPDEDLGGATLGDEIPVYTIKLQGHDTSTPVNSLLQSANEWLYPIILDGHVRYIVQVRLNGNDYVLENGSRALAMTYDKILTQWPASKGFHPKLITVSGLPAYYFTIPELPNQNITDTDQMFDINPELSPASIVLANLQ